jgi:LacI family transcriptional regulator
MRRPGMAELAAAAGLSVATVDRALNGRQKVQADTLAHIAAVARAIGHPSAARLSGYDGAGPKTPDLRIGVVLHKQGQDFYKAFAEALHRAVAAEPRVAGRLVLEFSTSQAPYEMARLMRSMLGRCDVLAATAVDHPEVSEAVQDLRAQGLAVFALLSDFALGARAGYLGLDNMKVGRTAGWMMAQVAKSPGKLALFVGGRRWNGHELRDQGFRAALRLHGPHLTVLETLVNLETRALTYDATVTLLRNQPDLRGIYVAGGGMEGAMAALRDAKAAGRVALIVSALTPDSRRGVKEGLVTMVIDTPLEALCRDLIGCMVLSSQGGRQETPQDRFLVPALILPEQL